jgi:hypothetical protein
VKNLSSSFLLPGYPGYTALRYSLHSVQTLKDKKDEAKSNAQYADATWDSMCSHPFSLINGASLTITNIGGIEADTGPVIKACAV